MRETSRHRQLIDLPVPPTMATLQTTSMALDLSGATICTGGAVASKKKNGNDQGTVPLKNKEYERELRKLQTKLVQMQEWVKATSAKVVVVFEGRDAAGKGA